MDIKETVYRNLLRLAKEHHCDEPARLMRVLGLKNIQHPSKMLKGKASIGNKTIKKLCISWGINESEFYKDPETAEKETMKHPGVSWELQMVIELMKKQIDSQADKIKELEGRIEGQHQGKAERETGT